MTATTSAWEEAHRHAARAGIRIRLLDAPADMREAADLLSAVWKVGDLGTREGGAAAGLVDPGMLVALAHAGNYVAGAYAGDELAAVCVAFFHIPADRSLHSHITGVRAAAMGSGIGRALKLHQRAWALDRGADTITWTTDPLVARNAFFNLHRLGADVTEYLPDFYGTMSDGVNRGDASDRVLLTWRLRDAAPRADRDDVPACAPLLRRGVEPVLDLAAAAHAEHARLDLVPDIETLRVVDPGAAGRWRLALREAMTRLRARGWVVTDADRRGFYRLEREHREREH